MKKEDVEKSLLKIRVEDVVNQFSDNLKKDKDNIPILKNMIKKYLGGLKEKGINYKIIVDVVYNDELKDFLIKVKVV